MNFHAKQLKKLVILSVSAVLPLFAGCGGGDGDEGGSDSAQTDSGAGFAGALMCVAVLLGAAGIVSVALGFASQTSASNLISGLFLLTEKPFGVGDVITVDGSLARDGSNLANAETIIMTETGQRMLAGSSRDAQ